MTTVELRDRERIEIRLGGFGGQGIILAAYILGRAATVHTGRNAVMSQSYGPESRGGACLAEVVIADGEIAYPRVTSPDVVAVLSQPACDQHAADRPPGSLLIVDSDLVTLNGSSGPERLVLEAPATRLAEEAGRRIVANIVLLGFICGATNVVDISAIRDAVAASAPKGTESLNLSAAETGYEYARELLARG